MSREKFYDESNLEILGFDSSPDENFDSKPLGADDANEILKPLNDLFDVKVIGNTRLNLRDAPNSEAPVVKVLLPHEKFMAAADDSNAEWFEALLPTGEHGYVLGNFVVKVGEE